jgi:flagellum-specific peptidoglycan hydrolase FlgJ
VQYERDRNLNALVAAVSRNYATDPAYANLIESIARQVNVLQAIGHAAGENGPRTAA